MIESDRLLQAFVLSICFCVGTGLDVASASEQEGSTTRETQVVDYGQLVERRVRDFLKKHKPPGLIVGLLTPEGERKFFSYGKVSAEGEAPDAETLFEIGSVSKTFTTLLLADLVIRGELKLESPVQPLLPERYSIPKRGTYEISLLELATHTSGLPDNPPNLIRQLFKDPGLQKNPFKEFDAVQLEECLREINPGDQSHPSAAYSNLGMGLLGEALCHREGKSYDELIRERIAIPLGMHRTSAIPPGEEIRNKAIGHAQNRRPVPYWEFGTLAGCGAICSTADDMLTYLEAQTGRKETLLSEAMILTQEPRDKFMIFYQVGLGWIVRDFSFGKRCWWHNGGTNGFSSYAAYCRDPAVAVVLLCNHGPDGMTGLLRMEIDIVGERILKDLIKSVEQ